MVDNVTPSKSNTLTWNDVENTAQIAFTSFEQPEWEWGALEWTWNAWEILIETGLATYSTAMERNQAIIRFLALAGFYIEFCNVAWEELLEPNYYGWAKTLKFSHYDAAHCYLEELTSFGFYKSYFDYDNSELDDRNFENLVNNAREEVLYALLDGFENISRLFDSLLQSRYLESDSELLDYKTNSHKHTAFEWLMMQYSSKIVEEIEPEPALEDSFEFLYINADDKTLYQVELGISKYQEGSYREAINKFDQALQVDPEFAYAYCYRGRAKAKIGDLHGARADYSKSLQIQPDQITVSNELGNINYNLRNYSIAIQNYNWTLDINPSLALTYYNRGRAYLKMEDKQRGIKDLHKASELFKQQENIDAYDKVQMLLKSIKLNYSEPSFTEIYKNVLSKGLRIAERTLRRYHLALKSRKFIILSGISGTGKTWISKAYADALEAEYLLVPVAPNWTTNEDLLGYLSPIDNKYHDTDFSTFLEKAEEEYQEAQAEKRTPRPYHLVLDEMNLARVEYYFAKFLSAMEVRMREGVAQIQLASEKQVLLPPNLYFIGTVNVDETTHSFADKVYDRAQLIELEAPRQDLYEHLGEVPYRGMLMQIWNEVHAVAPFAFRVLDEIKTYVKEAEALEVSWQDALDEPLLQKILPKLKGADDRVGVALKAFVDIVKEKDFPLSHKKASKMLDTFNQHGFTSYF
ncbi:MAG TPA: tetratricopeptide repeat protein [Allocoleopsis sp.]